MTKSSLFWRSSALLDYLEMFINILYNRMAKRQCVIRPADGTGLERPTAAGVFVLLVADSQGLTFLRGGIR